MIEPPPLIIRHDPNMLMNKSQSNNNSILMDISINEISKSNLVMQKLNSTISQKSKTMMENTPYIVSSVKNNKLS